MENRFTDRRDFANPKITKLIRGLFVAFALLPMMMSLTACNGNSQTAATTATTYTLTSGICYVTGTSTVVSTTYCGVTTTTGYTLSGSVCYVTGTSTVVSSTYCGTTTTTTGYTLSGNICYVTGTSTVVSSTYCGVTTTTGTSCVGYYYSPTVGWGYCNGTNCRGYYLYNQAGQLTYCQ